MTIDREFVRPLEAARKHLEAHNVTFERGLSDGEVDHIEGRFSFIFPPDLRGFLQSALPVSHRFPNWRGPHDSLIEMIDWPVEGITFDIRNRVFWWADWGARPESDDAAVDIATREIGNAPKLIPIFGHSYLPSEPCEPGNPVFSVHQADVIHRGANLAEYLFWLFHGDEEIEEEHYPVFGKEYKWIRFWSALAKDNAK